MKSTEAAECTPDELDEEQRLERHRRAYLERIGRVLPLNESPSMQQHRAAEQARRERSWRDAAIVRATERRIPKSERIFPYAIQPEPEQTEALLRARGAVRWRAEQPRRVPGCKVPALLFLVGNYGTGKSVAISWCVVWHEQRALYTTAAHITTAAVRTAHSDSQLAWSHVATPDLLVIDEIGDEQRGDPAVVVSLCRERFDAGLVTILAGNTTMDSVLSRYFDARLEDRLKEQEQRGLESIVALNGKSLRGAL